MSAAKFRLYLLERGRKIRAYRISVAAKGLGCSAGSMKTPLGWHRICAKIGSRAARGTVFKDRINTGEIWDGESQFGDLILSRILWLDGLETGKNRGGHCDSRRRYIYIHGTNHIKTIGRAASHGCITMKCADVIDLFNRVRTGDRIVISRR